MSINNPFPFLWNPSCWAMSLPFPYSEVSLVGIFSSCSSMGWNLVFDTCSEEDFYRRLKEFTVQLKIHIENDKKYEFVELIKSHLDVALKDFGNSETAVSNYLLVKCCEQGAVNCAAALLKGDTGLTLDLDDPRFWLPHCAAAALSPKMTQFFLKSGARATAKHVVCGSLYDGLLPIEIALLTIRRRVLWSKEESLFSLIVELTGEGMIEPNKTLRLLINEMSESEVSEVICRYAAEAKMIELASLLILCSERSIMVDNIYVSSSFVSSRDRMTLRQYVVNQIVLLENKVRKLVEIDSAKLAEYRVMKESMMTMLMLLEIFLRTGDKIAKVAESFLHMYPATRLAIARLFESSGFKLIGEGTSDLRKPLRRSQRDLVNLKANYYSQSGIPQVDSFETMPFLGWDESNPKYQKLLPMCMALEKSSNVIRDKYWTPNESIFKLIIMFCLPKMKEAMEEVRSFAEKSEMINVIACYYAKEGKLIELAIILMVARQKVMDPIKFQIKGDKTKRSMTFQQFINSELAQAIDLECRLVGRMTEQEKELTSLCKQRKLAMMSALTLLEISQKAGSDLQEYIWSDERKKVQKEQVVHDISKMLSKAGFKLKSKDTEISDTVDSSIKAAFEQEDEALQDLNQKSGLLQDLNEIAEVPTKSGSQIQDFRSLSYVLPCGFVETHATFGRPGEMRKFLFTRYPRECKSLPSGAQSFRAFWTSKGRSRVSAGFPKTLGVQQGDVSGVNQLVQKLPARKHFASVALALKKQFK